LQIANSSKKFDEHYELISKIAEGGHASVYLAVNKKT